MPKQTKLTEKQKRFCEEYLIDLNATQAAVRAGYSPKTAEQAAARLLRNVKVQEYLNILREKQSERTQITADMVLNELAAIAFTDRTELAQVVHRKGKDEETGEPYEYSAVELTQTKDLPDTAKKTIAGIKQGRNGVEVSSYDKIKALELLGKHLGMFSERKEESNENSEIIFNIIPASQREESQEDN